MIRGLIFVALVLSCSFAAVFGLRSCYLCNSYTDRDHTACIDPMSPYPAVNYTTCPNNYVCTRVSYLTQKQLVVSRGCDPSGNTCQNIYNTLYSYYPDISSFNCYYCTSDYCNGASGLRYEGKLIKDLTEKEVPSLRPSFTMCGNQKVLVSIYDYNSNIDNLTIETVAINHNSLVTTDCETGP